MTESESNKKINNYLSNDEINFADVYKFFKRNLNLSLYLLS